MVLPQQNYQSEQSISILVPTFSISNSINKFDVIFAYIAILFHYTNYVKLQHLQMNHRIE